MKYYAYAHVKFPVTDTHVYISPVMLLFLRKTGIHHLWLSNLITGSCRNSLTPMCIKPDCVWTEVEWKRCFDAVYCWYCTIYTITQLTVWCDVTYDENSCTTLKVYMLRQKPHLFFLRSLKLQIKHQLCSKHWNCCYSKYVVHLCGYNLWIG